MTPDDLTGALPLAAAEAPFVAGFLSSAFFSSTGAAAADELGMSHPPASGDGSSAAGAAADDSDSSTWSAQLDLDPRAAPVDDDGSADAAGVGAAAW